MTLQLFKEKETMSELTPQVREKLERELICVMDTASRKVVSYVILERVSTWMRLRPSRLASGIAATLVTLAVWLAPWTLNRLTGQHMSLDEIWQLALPAFLAGLCLWLVKIVDERVFISQEQLVVKLPAGKDGFEGLQRWFERIFTYRRQVVACVALGLVGLLSARALYTNFPLLSDDLGINVATFLAMAAVGNGAYFALTVPTVARTASQYRLNLYPYDPARSTAVRLASYTFGQLALGTGVAASVIMFLIFILEPWGKQTTLQVAFAWLIFVWALTCYAFIFPNFYVQKGIAKEKQLQLDYLEGAVRRLHERFDQLSLEELDRLRTLIDLRDRVSHASTSPIPFRAWADFLFSGDVADGLVPRRLCRHAKDYQYYLSLRSRSARLVLAPIEAGTTSIG